MDSQKKKRYYQGHDSFPKTGGMNHIKHGLLYTLTVQLLRFFESHRALKVSKNHSNTIGTSSKVIQFLKM